MTSPTSGTCSTWRGRPVDKTQGISRAQYDADENLRLALIHLIQTVGEAARRVSPEFCKSHPDVRWADIVIRLSSMTDTMNTDRGADVRFPPLRLVSLGFTVLGALVHLVAPIPFSGSWLVRSGGIAVVVAGVATAAWARNLFTRTGQNPRPWTPTPQLVFEGPYRFTRNPMYVSLTAIQIGLGLAVGVLWISLLAPVSLATIHVTAVRREERYLSEKFGRVYGDYRARVRRYL